MDGTGELCHGWPVAKVHLDQRCLAADAGDFIIQFFERTDGPPGGNDLNPLTGEGEGGCLAKSA